MTSGHTRDLCSLSFQPAAVPKSSWPSPSVRLSRCSCFPRAPKASNPAAQVLSPQGMSALDHFPHAQRKVSLLCSLPALMGCAQLTAAPGNLCTAPGAPWKELNSLMPFSTALRTSQSSSPPLPPFPSRLASTYSHWAVLHWLHSVSRCCLSAVPQLRPLLLSRLQGWRLCKDPGNACIDVVIECSLLFSIPFRVIPTPSASFLAAAKHPADIS